MSKGQGLDRETIHRRAREYAETRTILEIATRQDLTQDPQAIAALFFQAYGEFAARISGGQFERPRLSEAERRALVGKLALQATTARFAGTPLFSGLSLLTRFEGLGWTCLSDKERLFLGYMHRQLRDALSAQNRQE
jgi:hypothetical protein